MKHFRIFQSYFVLFSILLAGCRSDKAEEHSSEASELNRQAWELRESGAPASEFLTMQQRAVEALKNSKSPDEQLKVLAQMGYFYNVTGDYQNGIDYLWQAVDCLKRHPEYEVSEGAIEVYGNLGDIYVVLSMGEDALAANTEAINISHKLGGRYLPGLYRFRATIFDLLNMPDSVLSNLDKSYHVAKYGNVQGDRNTMMRAALSEKADYIIERGLWPDSLDKAVATLEALRDTPEWEIDVMSLSLGKGYLAQGRADEGIRLLEDAVEEYRARGDIHGLSEYCLPPLMDAYAKYGRYDKLGEHFIEYAQMRDTILNREKLNALVGADIRERASLLREENKTLELQHKLIVQRTVSAAAVAVLVFALLSAWIIYQRRSNRQKINSQLSKISGLLSERIMLNSHIEDLNAQLRSLKTAQSGDGAILQPLILEKEQEREFRQSFSAVHPHFLPELRREFQGLTAGNELVCMMIYMHKSTDEIALALGISRDSVNKTRYRLRQRFNLPREVDLDEFIRSRR